MKIAFAHYSSCADISGVTTWLIDFCDRLMMANHEVLVHLHHFGDDPQQGSVLPILHHLGIETHAVRRTGSLEDDLLQTHKFLNQVQPDLFLPQCLHAHYVAAAIAGRQGLPWIFTMHSDDPDYWCVAESLNPETHGGSSVCVSQFLAQQLRQRVPLTNPHVIPYGITLPANHANFSDQPFRVVYCGRMVDRQKCIHQVVDTFILGCQASNQFEAHLIGDGPARESCQKSVCHAGLEDRIHFHGRVPPEQVQLLLQRSQAILLMSDYEGLPIALLEAMATGVVPVVRTIESGIPELVLHEHTGLLVANEPREAATALVRLISEPSLWFHCSTQARSLIKSRYCSQQSFERWYELIERTHPDIKINYPLNIKNLHQFLPIGDQRFQMQYSSHTSLLNKFHPVRLAGALKRRIWI